MDGQTGFEKYYSGCKHLENFIPMVQGPATNRPGFRYIVSAKYSDKKCRLVPFDFSTEQAYVLEFGDKYIRFYMNRGQILDGSVPYEIATTYTEAELPELQFTQSNDILYIVHPNHLPAMLSRIGHTSWTLTNIPFIKRYYPSASMLTSNFDNFNAAYCVDNQYTTKGWDNNTGGVGTHIIIDLGSGNAKNFTKIMIYIAGAALNSTFSIRYSDDGITYLNAKLGWNLATEPLGWSETEWVSVGAYRYWAIIKQNAAQPGGDVMALEFYEVGKPSAWVAGEYPSSIAFFEQRLWLAYMQTIWTSMSGDFYNFSMGVDADNAMEYTIAAQQVNKIQWLASGKILVAGTAGGEYKISASSLEEAVTPLNIRIVRQSSYGSDYREALPILDIMLYLQRSKRKIREFTYNSLEDTFLSPDMTVLARHLFDSDINYMAYQQEPFSILWCVRADGVLLGFTYQRLEGITAWHKHITDGLFESATCIYGQNGNNELWVVVNRTIGGVTKRYIELLADVYDGNDLNNDTDCFFVDSGLTYNGDATSAISGLGHLIGKTVSIIADGFALESQVVDISGQISLDTPASRIHVGLPYTSILQTMRVETPDSKGTSQGRIKRINQCVFRFYKTKQFKYGSTPTGILKEYIFDSLFSGDQQVDFPMGWSKEGYVTIVQDKPFPITVVAIIPELGVS